MILAERGATQIGKSCAEKLHGDPRASHLLLLLGDDHALVRRILASKSNTCRACSGCALGVLPPPPLF